MKNLRLFLFVFLITLVFVYLIFREYKKVIITYKYAKGGIEIIESNNSSSDVFLCPQPFRIYREKYKDTLSIGTLRNGKQNKWSGGTETKNGVTIIACAPRPNGNPIFKIEKIIGIDKQQKQKVRLALIEQDSVFYKIFPKFLEEYPSYYFIKPKAKVVIKYQQLDALEKGKYKLFFNRREYELDIKKSLLPQFKLLESDEIDDNPLEFEVK